MRKNADIKIFAIKSYQLPFNRRDTLKADSFIKLKNTVYKRFWIETRRQKAERNVKVLDEKR